MYFGSAVPSSSKKCRLFVVYMVYSDRIIEGSPKNSTSTVPIIPWGSGPVAKCADWIEK